MNTTYRVEKHIEGEDESQPHQVADSIRGLRDARAIATMKAKWYAKTYDAPKYERPDADTIRIPAPAFTMVLRVVAN